MRRTITEALVRKALPGFIRDDRVIGFGLRTTKAGSKSFIAEARVAGRVRRFAIAPVDRLPVAEARDEAREILADMSKGVDPQRARRAKRERAKTLGEMLDDYLDAKDVKASTATKYRGVLRRTLGDWLKTPIAEITLGMVRVRYEQLAKRSVSEANNAMRVLRAVSRRAEVVLPNRADGSPAMKGVATAALRGAWRVLERRTRVLEAQEIGTWLKGVDSLRSERSKRALKTLLLSGLRVQEALGLSWRDVEEDQRRLIISDSKTGGFVKIIGPRLSAMLAEWKEDAKSGLVFEGVNDLRAALASIEREGGKAITPHDLRRPFASFAERTGAPFTTLKVLLNHSTRGDVTWATFGRAKRTCAIGRGSSRRRCSPRRNPGRLSNCRRVEGGGNEPRRENAEASPCRKGRILRPPSRKPGHMGARAGRLRTRLRRGQGEGRCRREAGPSASACDKDCVKKNKLAPPISSLVRPSLFCRVLEDTNGT
jgi:integrase